MGSKITIIGAGCVGAAIAYTLTGMDIISEIVLIDINKERAMGEAMDIIQGTSFRDPVSIIVGEYSDAKNSDIVIITSGTARRPGQSRTELTPLNVSILKQIVPQIVAFVPDALYLIVSNPVDIITYAFKKLSGLPDSQIIGTGTILDTARLRCFLSQHFRVSQKNVHAYVFGGHGESSFIPWSQVRISGVGIDEYCNLFERTESNMKVLDRDVVLDYVRNSGAQIIAGKGATFYGISAAVGYLCKCLLATTDTVATVSTMMHGEYDIEDVYLSTLALIGCKRVHHIIPVGMIPKEISALQTSVVELKTIIASLQL